MKYTDELKGVIGRLHGCEADHVETVPITEYFQGKVVWDGSVEVFKVRGHPKAKRCYAWAYTDDEGKRKYTAVLELPPVDSPRSAVKAAIVSEARKKV
jgi:hypothetical protein